MTVDSSGQIDPVIEASWGFSWVSFITHPISSVLLPPFLHWNITHLCLNLGILVVFTGGLEYLAGSGITALAFFIPMLISNPLTGVLAARVFHPNEIDIGASLGIFGCGGALSWFVRWGKWLVLGLAFGTVLAATLNHSSMMLNHLIAMFLGLLIGKFAV
jgi:membrane associated rhomboid family serine protease